MRRIIEVVMMLALCAGLFVLSACAGESSGSAHPPLADSSALSPDPDQGLPAHLDGGHLEPCDGLDNNSDGVVDEGCSCTAGASQSCYSRPVGPAEGCQWGEQICEGGTWSACQGATYPAEGVEACCTVLGDQPEHPLYEAFMLAYPPENMPAGHAAIRAFAPQTEGHAMQWSEVNAGGELVDPDNGGVTEANIKTGRAMARDAAEQTIPQGGQVIDELEGPVTIQAKSGDKCAKGGVGWAWGSLLFQMEDGAVSELVYLYIGYCVDADIEAFFYSEEPMEVCRAPVLE